MTMTELDDRTPEQIERDIVNTRESLKGKLNELEHRLSPVERVREVREHLTPESVAPWAAVGAIATGTVLALRGLRRHRSSTAPEMDDELMEEVVCVDVAVPPGVVP